MSERLSQEMSNFIDRIRRQFGDVDIPVGLDMRIGKAELFRRLTAGFGKGKPHCSQDVIKRDGRLRNT